MADFDKIIVFGKKTMSQILKDVYDSSKNKDKQITDLISQLSDKIVNLGDAIQLVPLIASYLEISVKNDEHIIKMLSIVQKASVRSQTAGEEEPEYTKEERDQLFTTFQEMGIVPKKQLVDQ